MSWQPVHMMRARRLLLASDWERNSVPDMLLRSMTCHPFRGICKEFIAKCLSGIVHSNTVR